MVTGKKNQRVEEDIPKVCVSYTLQEDDTESE
jgi:hypothetical protein